MKRIYMLIIVGLFLLVSLCIVASATSVITYNRGIASTYYDTISAYGTINGTILWNADRNGTCVLHSVTKTARDSVWTALQKPLHPTDEYVMGGSKKDLWVQTRLWDPTLTSINVVVNGTNITDVIISQNFTITGNGSFYFTDFYKTLTSVKITVWSGTGSIQLNISQGKFGMVTKIPNKKEYFISCSFILNGSVSSRTYWNETNATMISTSVLIYSDNTNHTPHIMDGGWQDLTKTQRREIDGEGGEERIPAIQTQTTFRFKKSLILKRRWWKINIDRGGSKE